MVNKTFVIIKPDGVERGLTGEIISRFEWKGLRIFRLRMSQQNEKWCRAHYSHLRGEVYDRVRDFMTYTPLVGMVLCGEEAVHVVKAMVGPTNSMDAPPGTIRGDYGTLPIHCNVVHAAESSEAANKEIDLFFKW